MKKIATGSAAAAFAWMLVGCNPLSQKQAWTVKSPDGRTSVTVTLESKSVSFGGNGQKTPLYYTIETGASGSVVIGRSPLGVNRADQRFTDRLAFESGGDSRLVEDSFVSPRGKSRFVRIVGNETLLRFVNPGGAKLDLLVRACDQGVAFKYRFPETDDSIRTVTDEVTGFRLPKGSVGTLQPYDSAYQWGPAYETFYRRNVAPGSASPTGEGWAFPALFRVYGGTHWVLLAEAGLDGSYFGARLREGPDRDLYQIRMPSEDEGWNTGEVKPRSKLPWETPWRVVLVGVGLGPIVESNLIEALNPPSLSNDTSWIRPGRVSWSWWSDNASPRNIKALREFVDLAADMGWEYSLVDANWNLMDRNAIPQLVQYAKKRKVSILLWYNSGGPHNIVTEQPRDRMFDPVLRDREMAWLERTGIKGVKVDFFHSDKPQVIGLYHGILKDALKHRLVVDFHGCTVPRGWSRTYPNLLTMEGVPGAEQYLFRDTYPETAPWQNTVFVFTRNAIGPMDYTPVAFTETKFPHLTTNCHELALSVVFESGLQHFADKVSAFRSLPPAPRRFLMNVPTAWDETRFVEGEPGILAVLARRRGTDWFVGGINGEGREKNLKVPLAFLPEGGFEAEVIADDADPRSFGGNTFSVTAASSIPVDVLPYGGFVMHVKPIQ